MPRKRGFTLIELLVVIAMIAILAAVLFPVFAQARDKARQATCLSNIKQLSLAVQMYAQDHDDQLLYYPGEKHCDFHFVCEEPARWYLDWWDVVLPYTRNNQIYDCPSAQGYKDPSLPNPGVRNVSIGYNFSPYGTGSNSLVKPAPGDYVYPGVSLAEVTRPADTIMLGEAGHVWNPIHGPYFNARDLPSPSLCYSPRVESAWEWGPEPRHGGGANVGFVDGHAKWMKLEKFYGAVDVATRRITLDCNGIWFRPDRDQRKPGDPPPPACGQ